jgi:hypothetical protein
VVVAHFVLRLVGSLRKHVEMVGLDGNEPRGGKFKSLTS